MKKQGLLFILIICTIAVNAQQKVALHSNGTTSVFGGTTPFVDAYNAAQAGDTIYLPGSPLTYPTTIDKSLVIFGTGHYPDSTSATGRTVLYGDLTIGANADSIFIEGIELSGYLYFASNAKVDYATISRCKLNFIKYNGTQTTPCEYNTIKECVITSDVYLDNATMTSLSNNIIQGRILNGNSNSIENNILLYSSGSTSYYTLNNVDNSTISNNIFFKPNTYVHNQCESNTFTNNVFSQAISSGSNTFNSNYYSVDLTTLFVNQTGTAFDYTHDYHLVNPATYIDTEGTQISIYGGVFPYKASSVPSNPHINFKNISTTTDSNGLLNISIKVNAQQE